MAISLAGGEQHARVPVDRLDRLDPLAQPERHVGAPQQVLERLADLAVEEAERAVALVDDGDLGAERAEHRGVLDADHAGPDDRHRARDAPLEVQQPVRVDDRAVVERDGVRPRGLRPDGDHDAVGPDRLVGARDPHRVLVLERGVALEPADHVAAELLPHDRGLGAHDVRGAVHQLPERLAVGLLQAGGVEHVERALGELVEHRLAQRLGGDRAGVDRDAAQAVAPLRDRDALAELGGLDGRLLTRRAGADDEEIELHGRHPRADRRPARSALT